MNTLITKVLASGLSVSINGSDDNSYVGYVSNLVNFTITRVAPIASLIVCIIAAFLYFTAAGNETRSSKAKELFVGTIVGYIFLLSISMIARFLIT